MSEVVTLTIDDKLVSALPTKTVLAAAKDAGIDIPTLCHLEGLSDRGGCRLCLVEVEGNPRLMASCVTQVAEGMVIKTQTERLQKYRKMMIELLLAERNHICAACVMNGNCELQAMAAKLGVDHVRYDYLCPDLPMDASHERNVRDPNRCILCARCVRVCDEVEGGPLPGYDGAGHSLQRHYGHESAVGPGQELYHLRQVCPGLSYGGAVQEGRYRVRNEEAAGFPGLDPGRSR